MIVNSFVPNKYLQSYEVQLFLKCITFIYTIQEYIAAVIK